MYFRRLRNSSNDAALVDMDRKDAQQDAAHRKRIGNLYQLNPNNIRWKSRVPIGRQVSVISGHVGAPEVDQRSQLELDRDSRPQTEATPWDTLLQGFFTLVTASCFLTLPAVFLTSTSKFNLTPNWCVSKHGPDHSLTS